MLSPACASGPHRLVSALSAEAQSREVHSAHCRIRSQPLQSPRFILARSHVPASCGQKRLHYGSYLEPIELKWPERMWKHPAESPLTLATGDHALKFGSKSTHNPGFCPRAGCCRLSLTHMHTHTPNLALFCYPPSLLSLPFSLPACPFWFLPLLYLRISLLCLCSSLPSVLEGIISSLGGSWTEDEPVCCPMLCHRLPLKKKPQLQASSRWDKEATPG